MKSTSYSDPEREEGIQKFFSFTLKNILRYQIFYFIVKIILFNRITLLCYMNRLILLKIIGLKFLIIKVLI